MIRVEPHIMDMRALPIPEPYDKHDPHPSRNQRHKDSWTWSAWRDWLLAIAGRKWNKSSIRKVLSLRDSDPANRATDFRDTKRQWNTNGWIYALFNFASGRWYVGQTVRNYWVRAKEPWDQRKQLSDVLHNALAIETAPFSYAVFPLEKIDNTCTSARRGKPPRRPSGTTPILEKDTGWAASTLYGPVVLTPLFQEDQSRLGLCESGECRNGIAWNCYPRKTMKWGAKFRPG